MLCVCMNVHGTKARKLNFMQELCLLASFCVHSKIINAKSVRGSNHVGNNYLIIDHASTLKNVFFIFRKNVNPVVFFRLLYVNHNHFVLRSFVICLEIELCAIIVNTGKLCNPFINQRLNFKLGFFCNRSIKFGIAKQVHFFSSPHCLNNKILSIIRDPSPE